MKKVEPIITIDEFGEKIEAPLKEEIKKSIQSCKDVVQEKIKTVSKTWYKILKWVLLLMGIPLIAVGCLYISSILKYLAFLGGGFVLTGGLMIYIASSRFKGIDQIYRNAMNLDKIYEITINGLPNFKYVSSEEGPTENLVRLTHSIPHDANLESASRCFKVLFKDKYEVEFQSGEFHWVTYTRDSKGNRRAQHHYASSGFATFEFDKKENKHEFTMHGGNVFGESKIEKVDLENKDFVKRTKFKSNDPIKARMMFTPLAMEETLKLQKQIPVPFDLSKIGDMAYYTYNSLNNQFLVDADYDKEEDKTIEQYFVDIIVDFYRLYEILGTITIPPVL